MAMSGAYKHALRSFIKGFVEKTATGVLERELEECENIFLILSLGHLIGIPSPPLSINMRILPHMMHEVQVWEKKSGRVSDVLAELFGSMGPEL